MDLNDHGIYKLPDGREFLVRAARHGGYVLHDLRLGVSHAPVYLIDGSGTVSVMGKAHALESSRSQRYRPQIYS